MLLSDVINQCLESDSELPTKPSRSRIFKKCDKITVEELVSALLHQCVFPYENNRGGQPLDWKRVISYSEKWLVNSSGAFIWSNEGKMADCHHRLSAALLVWLNDKEQWESIKNEEVFIRTITPQEFIETYIAVNTAKTATTTEKLLCKDLCMGDLLHTALQPLLTNNASTVVTKGKLPPLGSILFAMKRISRDKWNFVDVYECRGKTKEFYNAEAGAFKLSKDAFQEVAKAIEDYSHFHSSLETLGHERGIKAVSDLLNSSGLWSLYLQDRLTVNELPSSDVCARNCIEHIVEMTDLCKALTRGGSSVIICVARVYSLMNNRQRRSRKS